MILFFIIFSTITLAIENPLNDPSGKLYEVLGYMDIALTAIFALEMVLKIISFGFIFNGKKSYLRNSWNIIDFTIVTFSLIDLSADNLELGIFKVLRLLRVLRPLRIISKNEGLKISIGALIIALPQVFNVLLISGLFFLIFGILGLNYFKGIFFSCNKEGIVDSGLSIVTKWDCYNLGGSWKNSVYNFDDIMHSMQTLYGMANPVGWAAFMYSAVNSTGQD